MKRNTNIVQVHKVFRKRYRYIATNSPYCIKPKSGYRFLGKFDAPRMMIKPKSGYRFLR